jgi:hypothetical protein
MDIIYDTIGRLGESTKEPRVFISYTGADKSFVETVARSLESDVRALSEPAQFPTSVKGTDSLDVVKRPGKRS